MVVQAAAAPAEQITTRARSAAVVVASLLAAATLASFLGALWWGFELLAHFRPQWAALSLLLLVITLALRVFGAAALCLACLLAHLVPLAPYLLSRPGPSTTTPPLRVLTANLHGRNADVAKFAALIAHEQPDVVVLTEVPRNFASVAAGLTPSYPHTIMERPGAAFEVIVLSRWPIKQRQVNRGVGQSLPVVSAEVCSPVASAGCAAVIGLHGARPFGRGVHLRNAQLALAVRVAAARGDEPVILVGDLNLTPWAPTFAALLEAGNLRDASTVRGLTATWRSRHPLFGLLIDHVLVNQKVTVVASRIGPDIGSDHLPVIADLAFQAPFVPPVQTTQAR
jgi:endonuclease/exonuclease/phosphatase (EEP) superfamily protein YafD